MSRIGNRVLSIPSGLSLSVNDSIITVSDNKRSLTIPYLSNVVSVLNKDNVVYTKQRKNDKFAHSYVGTVNALINNCFIGLSTGYTKTLIITGSGYRAAYANGILTLSLGYSHPVKILVPENIELTLVSPTEIKLSSYDKQGLGEFAAQIRSWKKPEPYKGKGIAYSNEVILRKVGKTAESGKKK